MIELKSKEGDPYLHGIIYSLMIDLLYKQKMSNQQILIEERPIGKSFFYCLDNTSKNLRVYIGRDAKNNKVSYIAMNNGLINWATKEGFFDDGSKTSDWADELDLLLRLKTINDCSKFILGEKNYEVYKKRKPSKSKT